MTDLRRIIWLASFPKSGNTWTRIFLANYIMGGEKAVDINRLHEFTTADVRGDFFDRAAGGTYRGETFDDWMELRPTALRLIAQSRPGTHFVKTHNRIMRIGPYDLIPPEVTAAAIYVMRNPFDVAPSYAQHMGWPIDDAVERMASPTNTTSTPQLIFELPGRWDEHIESWLKAPGLPRHVMRYEDLVADAEKTFRSLLSFLQVPLDFGRLRRAIRASSFNTLKKMEADKGFKERPATAKAFFRKGKTGTWREELSPSQVARIREAFLPMIENHYPEMLEETASFAASA
ncbi:MAG: sulfotransferase domain-containing protein [Pseudomonadota bacterium]